jgi:CRP-like cAMP-binding protein
VLFIESGSLALVDEGFRNSKILEIGEGLYIGETDLLLNNYIRKYTVMSTTRCVVYVLKRNDFKSMITLYKSELEDFVKEAKRRNDNLYSYLI